MYIKYLAAALAAASLMACGGVNPKTPSAEDLGPVAAGKTFTLMAGQTVEVPAKTMVHANGSIITIDGNKNTVSTTSGALVEVPADAIGPADNIVTAK